MNNTNNCDNNKKKPIEISKVKDDFIVKINQKELLEANLEEKRDKNSYIPKTIDDVDGLEYCES